MKHILLTHCRLVGDLLSRKIVPFLQRFATKPWLFWPAVFLGVMGVFKLIVILPQFAILHTGTGLFLAFLLGCAITGGIFIVIITQRSGASANPFVLQYTCNACGQSFTEVRLKEIYKQNGIKTRDLICPTDYLLLRSSDRIEDQFTENV